MNTQRFSQQRRFAAALLGLIVLLALGLRCYRLDAQSLWNDEGTSLALAQRDLLTIGRDAAHDIHPPLYYWLLAGWVRLAGSSEAAVRSLSVLLGVVLVALTYSLGQQLVGRWAGLVAALLAAVNPFQIYYSQEARMYMLAAALAAGTVVALVRYVRDESRLALLALVLLEAAGLYTHYSFAFVILILNGAYALQWRPGLGARRAWLWGASQAAVLVLYLPWLPIALRQVTAWPAPAQTTGLLPALLDTWRWLVLGPTVAAQQMLVPLLLAGVLAVIGALGWGLGRIGKPIRQVWWNAGLVVLWLGLPVILMFALGLYREAYLKFLLVTAPAVSLLLTCGLIAAPPIAGRDSQQASRFTVDAPSFARYALGLLQLFGALSILAASGLALRNYYADPAYARDDYRGIAAYVEAASRPGDAVLLNAPGQQEVFGYYYDGDLPVYALPEDRPLDPVATRSALSDLAVPGRRVFGLFWATDESDPERVIEGWLDEHTYKALDSWYGNVRLVIYAIPQAQPSVPDQVLSVPLAHDEPDDTITLRGYSLLTERLAAGDIAQITLFWEADRTPARRYKIFLHVLDDGNHIVGQRDAEPGGGARLTTLWEPGETVTDNYGLPIHPATPPGEYRLEVGLYDPETGARLITPEGAGQVWLEPLTVERPTAPAPVAALGMQYAERTDLGALILLGYDAHRLGFEREPGATLQPGDVLHVNLYWQAETEVGGDWGVTIELVDAEGRGWASVTAEPAGGYPTSRWEPGDLWRGQFNLAIPEDAPRGQYRLRVRTLVPEGSGSEVLLSELLRIGTR